MDDDIKRHLDAMEARIMAAIESLRADLTSEIEIHLGAKRLDAVARKLEGEDWTVDLKPPSIRWSAPVQARFDELLRYFAEIEAVIDQPPNGE